MPCFRYIGVDQVLLYDNSENGGAQAAELADFIQDGYVTYFTVPGQAKQIPVYQHCLTHSSDKYSWLATIDIDEFLVVEDEVVRKRPPQQQLKTILRDFRFYPGELKTLLQVTRSTVRAVQRCLLLVTQTIPVVLLYKNKHVRSLGGYAAVFLQWKGFGPGHHHDRPEPGGPLKHYTQCMPLEWPPANMQRLVEKGIPPDAGQAVAIVKYGKTIANRFWTSHASTAHGFMYLCALATPTSSQAQPVFCFSALSFSNFATVKPLFS
jgi:hypothetical protein